jgi:hypothetical protein
MMRHILVPWCQTEVIAKSENVKSALRTDWSFPLNLLSIFMDDFTEWGPTWQEYKSLVNIPIDMKMSGEQ